MSDWCLHKNCTEMLPCILSLLRPPAGRELWDTGTRGSARPCHLLGTRHCGLGQLKKASLFHPVPRKLLGSLCQVPAVLKMRQEAGFHHKEMLQWQFSHRTIKMCRFTLVTRNLHDISRLWATSQSGSRRKARKTDYFLFTYFILVTVSTNT